MSIIDELALEIARRDEALGLSVPETIEETSLVLGQMLLARSDWARAQVRGEPEDKPEPQVTVNETRREVLAQRLYDAAHRGSAISNRELAEAAKALLEPTARELMLSRLLEVATSSDCIQRLREAGRE